MTLIVRSTQLDLPRDTALLDLHLEGAPPDLVAVRDGEGLVAWGTALRLDVGTGPGRFDAAAGAIREVADHAEVRDDVGVPGSGLVAVGSFSFAEDEAGSILVVPACSVVRRGGRTWLTRTTPPGAASPPAPAARGTRRTGPRDRVRFGGTTTGDLAWLDAVDRATHRIAEGRLEKVVLARDQLVWRRQPFDLHGLVLALADRFPSCTTFRVEGLVGASPEPLLGRDGAALASRVLAGTTARSPDPDEDARLGEALLASDKDRHEHALAVESVRSALAGLTDDITVHEGPRLLRLANVQHLSTDLTASVDPRRSSLELVGHLHPTAAVGGTPRNAALDAIRELEGTSRGRYAGPVGWTSASGDGEWALALRCGQFEGAHGRLFAGAGIVAGSLPEAELAETWLKLAAMRETLTAAGGGEVG